MNESGSQISNSTNRLWQRVREGLRWLSRGSADSEPEGRLRRAGRFFAESVLGGLLVFLDLTDPDSFFPRWALIFAAAMVSLAFLTAVVQLVAWMRERVTDRSL